jgi:hypothetical protein
MVEIHKDGLARAGIIPTMLRKRDLDGQEAASPAFENERQLEAVIELRGSASADRRTPK